MFRKEAIEASKQKLHGDVFLVQPLSFSVLGFLILCVVTLLFIYLVTGTYSRSENVIGHIVPDKGLVKIQAAGSGTLQSIHVVEGQLIESGQTLVTVKVSTNTLDGVTFADKALAAMLRQEFELQTLVTLETNQLDTELERLNAEREQLIQNVASLRVRLDLNAQLAASSEDAFNTINNLRIQGYVSEEVLYDRRQRWLRQKSELKFSEQQVSAAEAKLKLLEIRLLQLPNESRQRVARIMAQKAELEGRKSELSARSVYAVISSVAGKVVSISVNSVGRSIQAGQPILTVMPEGSVLRAELFVPSRAIGFVEKGQEVRLLYDAFPYQFFGSYKATDLNVTETILAPGEILASLNLREPVYRVTASIENPSIEVKDKVIALQSGMNLKANIILERRSFMDWLLQPIQAVRGRS